MLAILFLLTIASLVDEPQVTLDFDKKTNISTTTLDLGSCRVLRTGREIELLLHRKNNGEGPLTVLPSDRISLQMVARNQTWIYLSHHQVSFLIDGRKIVLEKPQHHGSFGRSGIVQEQLFLNLPLTLVSEIGIADRVAIWVGRDELNLGKAQRKAVQDYASRLTLDRTGQEQAAIADTEREASKRAKISKQKVEEDREQEKKMNDQTLEQDNEEVNPDGGKTELFVRKILGDYEAGVAYINRLSLKISRFNRPRYLKVNRALLISELAEKYRISEENLSDILNDASEKNEKK